MHISYRHAIKHIHMPNHTKAHKIKYMHIESYTVIQYTQFHTHEYSLFIHKDVVLW
jgi:hypothetical protein